MALSRKKSGTVLPIFKGVLQMNERKPWYSPIGQSLSCETWETEALLRLLLNSLDPRVAERPDELIVYGGRGKATRDEQSLQQIIAQLKRLKRDETLLIQSGKPVGVFKTYEDAPRVISSTSMLVPAMATDAMFKSLEEKGLTMYGQATAASWSYIGVQGILQTTFETMGEIAARYFDDSLKGRIVLSSGLGGMGSAQPLSISMHGGVSIIVEIDEEKVNRRLLNNYCDIAVHSTKRAIELAQEAAELKQPLAIALIGNAPDVYREMLNLNFTPSIVTDQTAAHDLVDGYVPEGLTLEQANYLRKNKRKTYINLAQRSVVRHVKAMLEFQRREAVVFDYGNNIRGQAYKNGLERAFNIPNFVTQYIRPLYSEGRGPCRWIALSGSPSDIYAIDEKLLNRYAHDTRLQRWLTYVQNNLHFYGLPARTCWLNYEERIELGQILNDMVANGELQGPVAITRDHSEASTIAAPYRESEAMKDGSDSVADWPILLGMLNASAGASMVTIQHGGGVGIGNSIHTGMTVVADGTLAGAKKLERVLKMDPALSIIRLADAGYEKAQEMVRTHKLKKPL